MKVLKKNNILLVYAKDTMLIKYYLIAFTSILQFTAYPQDEDSLSVFLVKQRWHTGIVIKTSDLDSSFFPNIHLVRHFKYFDTGWGDEEFYRHPDFDLGLAIKALFYPTTAALRIEGFNFELGKYIEYSDKVFEIRMIKKSFNLLCSFISETFSRNQNTEVEVLEKRYNGNITFYKANGKYSLFNTCNTWVAAGLQKSGFSISKKLVLVEQLFDEIENLHQVKRLK